VYLGIKVGPDNWREKLVNDLDIRHVEVYLDLAELDAYPPLFAWLSKHGIQAGLHASTALDGGLMSNLATADSNVRRASAALFRRIIDIAADSEMRFVVIHPGWFHNWGISQGRTFRTGAPTPIQEGTSLAIDHVLALATYGRTRGIELLAENLPPYDYASYRPFNRDQTLDVSALPYTVLRTLGGHGASLCLDVGHLYAESVAHTSGEGAFSWVMAVTQELVPFTRHVHLSTVVPPWNGTDSHNGFLEADYAQGAVPDRGQLLTWLQLFAGRDVWVIPEPWGKAEVHLANYRTLCTWMEQIL
jgi:sugar phosphate isomerase/epimerase